MSQRILREVKVPPEHAGHRLDQSLADLLAEYSRTRIKQWIEAGEVRVDGAILRAKDKVLGGETVAIDAALPVVENITAEPIDLNVVHQDEHVLVVDKPAGLVVHPGAGNSAGTLQNALLHFDPQLAHLPRSGIVHRLDKDTSGLLVIARTLQAHTALVAAIEAREVKREYEAICLGVMTGGGTVDAPIDRHPVDRTRMSIRENGRPAVTHYRVLKRFRGHTHVRVQLETGRTHQIRVHMAHIRYPLVGDGVYGGRLLLPKGATEELRVALREFRRQALHAARLEFAHPISGESVVATSVPPADMKALLAVLTRDVNAG
jgi:23S rRNA pseudouridine1911/1915/1917 synthase